MIPDFSDVDARAAPTAAATPTPWRAAVQAATGKGADALAWETPEGIDVKPLYTAADLDGLDFLDTYPGIAPYLRGPYPTMYVNQPWTIRQYAGLLHRRGVQRLLPPQPRRRAEGPVGRLRPGHPPRLRQRPPARGRRRRHGRRGDRLDPRHAPAVRRHPARPDERVDDDERRGAAGAGALHRGGRGAGRAARAARRDHPERHPQGVHGPQHLHLPARARRCGSSPTSSPSPSQRDAEVQLDLDLRLPHAGGRGDGRPRAGLHARRRRRVPPRRAATPGSTSTRSRRGCRSSGRSA